MKPMNDYTKGILTGASLILCFFMFVGARVQGNHEHDTTEINYNSYTYGGYGSLQAKINELDSHDHYGEFAEQIHSHYQYADEGHSHYEYASTTHSHY
jgi:hypothetical protein